MAKSKTLVELRSKYSNIMADIESALTAKKLKYVKTSRSEIVVEKSTKKAIMSIITPILSKKDIEILLDVIETSKWVYIRKKIK